MTASIVAIDVEPRKGAIGVAELIGLDRGDQFMVTFDSQIPRKGYAPAAPDSFRELWPWLEAFVGGRPVVAHAAWNDATWARHLLSLAGISSPGWRMHCTCRLARRLLPRPGWRGGWTLPDLLVGIPLITPEERAQRWEQFLKHGGNQWLLPTAVDDAGACLDIIQWVARTRETDLSGVLQLMPDPKVI